MGAIQKEDRVCEQVGQPFGSCDVGIDRLTDQGRVETVAAIVEEVEFGVSELAVIFLALFDDGVDFEFTCSFGGDHGCSCQEGC